MKKKKLKFVKQCASKERVLYFPNRGGPHLDPICEPINSD